MSPSAIVAAVARPKCSVCEREFKDEDLRDITVFGHRFLFCETDFQLIWQGFAGLKMLAEQFKVANATSRVVTTLMKK